MKTRVRAVVEVVGLPAAGWAGLGGAEQALVKEAEVVFGGDRHLALLPEVPGQRREGWPRPLRPGLAARLDAYAPGGRIVVLASGDPLTAGIGTTLIELLGPARVRIHPALSSVTLARARLGWSAEQTTVIRLTSRTADEIRTALAPGRRLVLLSRDQDSPAAVSRVLVEAGFGPSRLTVLGDLGAATETRLDVYAYDRPPRDVPRLHLIAVECVPDRASPAWSTAPGLPDDAYEHDGQLTKRLPRAAALAALRPAPGELLWDVGAGAGSISIEWNRAGGGRALAVEHEPERASRIARNAARLGATGVEVRQGSVPDALAGLPAPDAVFFGGGISELVIEHCLAELKPGGRLVAHAVTTETEALLLAAHRRHGGEVVRLAVEHLHPLGRYSGWDPARAVVQWSLVRPLPSP